MYIRLVFNFDKKIIYSFTFPILYEQSKQKESFAKFNRI